jgi:hypothetical protein
MIPSLSMVKAEKQGLMLLPSKYSKNSHLHWSSLGDFAAWKLIDSTSVISGFYYGVNSQQSSAYLLTFSKTMGES